MLKPQKKSEYCKVRGPQSVKKWLKTWFYVKNTDNKDNKLNLPKYVPGPPADRGNWDYYPADEDGQIQLIYTYIQELKKAGQLRPEDLICTFLKRRVSPLQLRAHKICHMSGLLDPTRHSTFELSNADVWKRLKDISYTQIEPEWTWGKEAFHRGNMPPESVNSSRINLAYTKICFGCLPSVLFLTA